MTLSILKRAAGQTIARPFGRSSNIDELREFLGHHIAYEIAKAQGFGFSAAKAFAVTKADAYGAEIVAANLDTEQPIFVLADVEFFAFIEL